jgi:ADP-heptose:LPS heptosyltransferase
MNPQTLVDQALSHDPARAAAASRALFRDVIEPWADAFDGEKCWEYARFFSTAVAQVDVRHSADRLVERYSRVRRARRFDDRPPADVTVLSRVTLGADVAVTSVFLDAAKQRFPEARIHFAGPRKNFEMFAADLRLRHLDVPYARTGLLRERIEAGLALEKALSRIGGIVIDPDSRLTQLGLLPVCAEDRYFFWESRSYGGDGDEPLSALARRWAAATFAVSGAQAYIAPALPAPEPGGDLATVSFGFGENPAKRAADPFEERVVSRLAATGMRVLVDEGAGGDEAERARRAVAHCGSPNVSTFRGPFAGFAASIARSRLYAGYDSAGQHVAAACGVPLVAVFGGFSSERMLARWSPSSRGAVKVIRTDRESVIERTLAAIEYLTRRSE